MAPAVSISALSGHEWSALCWEKEPPGTYYIGGGVDHRASVDTVWNRKISCLYWELNPSHRDHRPQYNTEFNTNINMQLLQLFIDNIIGLCYIE
jgi:hypothetical protein